jgi:signal peptidase II
VTKSWAVHRLADGPDHLFGPFSFALTYNTGIAFSLLSGWTLPIVIGVVVLVGVVAYLGYGARTIPSAAAVGLILGGATGNLCDRLFRGRGGAVVDFIHTGFWPTFNVGDSSIVIGCVALALVVRHHSRPHPVTVVPASSSDADVAT